MVTADAAPTVPGGLRPEQVGAVLDTVFDPVLLLEPMHDADGRIEDFRVLAANAPACDGLGVTREAAAGARLLPLLTDDERALLLDPYRTVVESGRPLHLDAVTLHYPAGGVERRFDVRAARVGALLSVTWREVTDLWRERETLTSTRAALEDSEHRFRMIADLSTDFVMEVGTDLRITWASPSITRSVGWLPEEVVGQAPWDLTLSKDAATTRAFTERGLAGEELTGRRRFLCRDGTSRWVDRSIRPLRGEDGEVRSIVAGFRVIDAEVEAEARLAASEEHYRLLADNATDIVFRSGPDGVVHWVSPSMREVLGWDPDEIVGHRSAEFCHPDDLPLLRERTLALARGMPMGVLVRLRHKAGGDRWIEVKARPVLDAGGDIIGRVGSLRDVTEQHEAVEALRASEARFRAVVSGLLDPLVVLRPVWNGTGAIVDFAFEFVNPAACVWNGLGPDETIGRRISELVPQLLDDGTLERWVGVMVSGEPYTAVAYRDPGNETSGRVLRHADSSAFRLGDTLVVTWRDVTAQQAAQAAVLEAETRYRLLLQSASDMVVLTDPDAVITWASPSARTVLGWDPESLVGRSVRDLVYRDDQAAWTARRDVIDRERSAAYTARFQRADGGFCWMSVATTAIRDEAGAILARTGILRDITAEHDARQALEASRLELAEAQRVAHVGSWTWAPGDVITWSAEAFRIMGREPAEAVPPPSEQAAMYPASSRIRLRHALARAIETGEPFEEALEVIRPDGSIRHAITRGEAVRDVDGRVVLVRGTTADVTELREAELRIRELNEGLEQRVRERTEELETFTYTLSHDLRAPLRWINGFAAMLQRRDGDRLDETSRHYLDEIRNASDRMDRLFEELLDYSRLGRYAVRAEPVEWAPIVAALRGTFGPRVAGTGATLEIEDPLPPVLGDAMLLERLLTNLVDNGLTYTAPGTPAHVTVSARRDGARVTITVSDRGIGIPADQQERIFHPFVRLHDDDAYPGTGIGLAIVGRAARLLGSEIRVRSTPGEGSSFMLELPAA